MKSKVLSKFGKDILFFLDHNKTGILTGLGIGGMIGSTILAVKSTPEAVKRIQAAEQLKGEPLTKKEIIQETWTCYAPAAAASVASATLIMASDKMSGNQNAALMAAYKTAEAMYDEYKEAAVEVVGEKKEREIQSEVAKQQILKNPPTESNVIFSKGKTLCYESLSGQYFYSEIEEVKSAFNMLNHRMINDWSVTVNEFLGMLGLHDCSLGDSGWNMEDGPIELVPDSHLVPCDSTIIPEGTPCYAIRYSRMPVPAELLH